MPEPLKPLQSKEADAERFLDQALAIFRTQGNDVGIVECLERIGEIHRRGSRHEQAFATLDEAIHIASRCGDKLGEIKALNILGMAHLDDGDLTKAASILSEVCDSSRRIGWEYGVCTALWDLGTIKMREDRYQEAEELLQESISVARRIKASRRVGQVLSTLGRCLRLWDRIDEATKAIEEAFSAYQEVSLIPESAEAASLVAEMKRDQGARRDSLVWYDVAVAQYRKLRDKPQVLLCLGKRAEILTETEDYDEAALNLEASLILDRELGYDVYGNRSHLSKIPKTIIKWESRKHLKTRFGPQQGLPLLCDVHKLQRRLPQLRSTGLKLDLRIGERGDP